MKGYTTALALSLLLGVAGFASAATAVIDFTDSTKNTDATVVKNADGAIADFKEGTFNVAKTGGAAGNQYLYVDVKDGLFNAGDTVYIQVQYFDAGTDTWQLEYNTDSDPATLAQPVVQKNDTKVWKSITFKQVDANLTGGLDGKADIRINDNADGSEEIRRILVTNIDPDVVQFPSVDPAHPIVLDAKKDAAEWDGAWTFTLTARTRTRSSPATWCPARSPASTPSNGMPRGCTCSARWWTPRRA